MRDEQLCVVLCNCPVDDAKDIAQALVASRLVSCVNLIGGVESVYRWQGEVVFDRETTLLIKTTVGGFGALEARLFELHPYDVPEIIALEPTAVLEAYAQWNAAQVVVGGDLPAHESQNE